MDELLKSYEASYTRGREEGADVLVSHPSLIRVKYKRALNILVLCDSLCNSKSVKIKKKLLLFRSNYEF